jgi:outer membrane protein assembly factor BamE (lipoprotein component of BamABCDE complex)
MGRIGSNLTAATLLLMCASCATTPGQRAGWPSAEDFAKIAVNKTTANEVRELLGPPSRNLTLRAHQGETWGYRHGGKYDARMFWIEFSPDGVAREVSDSADFEADKRYGCS